VSHPEDTDLVVRALAGSQDAFRDLVTRYQRPVFALILRMVRDPQAAEELAQETFVKCYGRLATYDAERRFSSWLFKIAHNTTIDHLRRGGLETVPLESGPEEGTGLAAVLEDGSVETPDAAVRRRDLREALERSIATLRPDYRAAVLMRYAEGLSYEEIVEATGLPLGTVKTNLHRARKQLAEAMRELGWAPPD
jgi:RNA polymerase sigma-70 factor, ECF subfamily